MPDKRKLWRLLARPIRDLDDPSDDGRRLAAVTARAASSAFLPMAARMPLCVLGSCNPPSANMLVGLSVIPIGRDSHTSAELAEVLKLIDESGLRYPLTPSSTCIEGNWNEVMPVVRLCHERIRARCPHVVTTIKIEDDAGAPHQLESNVAAIEEKLGRPLRNSHSARVVSSGP